MVDQPVPHNLLKTTITSRKIGGSVSTIHILIIDSACDQSIITSNAFITLSRSGQYFHVNGALSGRMESDVALEVVDAVSKITLSNGSVFILQMNQSLLDTCPQQMESLLQPHQSRAHGVLIDDCPFHHKRIDGCHGTQSVQILDTTLPLDFDGLKCYFNLAKPTPDEIEKYPRIELTSPMPYHPKRIYTRRRNTALSQDVEQWRANLAFPTIEVTKKTLECTTQYVSTVEAETREYMRDHFKSRLLSLRPHRINDVCFSDTFFSSIRSVRGYSMFQMFAFRDCKHDVPYLMRKESQASDKLRDLIRSIGAMKVMVNDNAKAMTGHAWLDTLRTFCIEDHCSEAYHQNQNLAERRGGDLKTAIIKLYHNTTSRAPLTFWCYAFDFLTLVRGSLARKSLDWRPPEEALYGESLDISVFRFPWFSPVWYYNPRRSFPIDKMESGYFLGVANNVGDSFSYIVLPTLELDKYEKRKRHKPITLIRSVVRMRKLTEVEPPTCTKATNGFIFFTSSGIQLQGTVSLIPLEKPCAPAIPLKPTMDDPLLDVTRDGTLVSPVNATVLASPTPPLDPIFAHPTSITPMSEEIPQNNPHSDVPMVSQTQDSSDDNASHPVLEYITDDDDKSITSQPDAHVATSIASRFHSYDSDLHAILGHRYVTGKLELHVEYSTGEAEYLPYDLVLDDDPLAVAQYILDSPLSKNKAEASLARWARAFLRGVQKTVRRLFHINTTIHPTVRARSVSKASHLPPETKRKKKGVNNRKKGKTKYGVMIPRSYKEGKMLDIKNGNTLWQDAVEKEIAALIHHKCFDFKEPGYKPTSDYQYAPLNLVFEVKPDLTRKARLVIMGNVVDPRGLATRATVVKGISVRLLSLIAHRDGLTELCGDIGNAFIQADTNEKIYTRCGPEFVGREGSIALIVRALYGLCTSAERFRTLLANFLQTLGFAPTRYDRDVWIRLRTSVDGYDYICTHVDDFKIVAREPQIWLNLIKDRFLVKQSGPPEYYLGNDYRYEEKDKLWTVGCTTYTTEAVRRIEELRGTLRYEKTPLPVDDCHPELDSSPLLGERQHRLFQMLLGMAQWLNTIGRPDICFAVSSLSRFGSCPREGHLTLALHLFGYLKNFPNRRIAFDSNDIDFSHILDDTKALIPDFLQDYPGSTEELDNFPRPFGRTLQTTICCDADHAHDKMTRRSITGILGYVGRTPVLWLAKRQGAIATSTYAAEFMALRTATEEAISLRYMLRCLGIPIPNDGTAPTRIFGDNLSVIQNARNPHSCLSKKHVALSFHGVRESIAAGITSPFWIRGRFNQSDVMTKQIPSKEYLSHCDNIFWLAPHKS